MFYRPINALGMGILSAMSENIIGHLIFDFLDIIFFTVTERLVCDGIKS